MFFLSIYSRCVHFFGVWFGVVSGSLGGVEGALRCCCNPDAGAALVMV